jgi:hypothetical protein
MSAAPDKPFTIGYIIDEMYRIREQRREIAKQDKDLKEHFDNLEGELIKVMDEQQTLRSGGQLASAVISTDVYPNVTDWDTVYDYIKENDAFHLLKRQINAAPWRELFELGTPVPGTESFTKRTVSLKGA